MGSRGRPICSRHSLETSSEEPRPFPSSRFLSRCLPHRLMQSMNSRRADQGGCVLGRRSTGRFRPCRQSHHGQSFDRSGSVFIKIVDRGLWPGNDHHFDHGDDCATVRGITMVPASDILRLVTCFDETTSCSVVRWMPANARRSSTRRRAHAVDPGPRVSDEVRPRP